MCGLEKLIESLAPGRCWRSFKNVFSITFHLSILWVFLRKHLNVNVTGHHLSEEKNGSSNGKVLSGITWANDDPDHCRHMASVGHNVLIFGFLSISLANKSLWSFRYGSLFTLVRIFRTQIKQPSIPSCFIAYTRRRLFTRSWKSWGLVPI